MTRRFEHKGNLPTTNGHSGYDSYNLPQPTTHYSFQRSYYMSFKICVLSYDRKYCTYIDVWSVDTLLQLKEKVAHYLKIGSPPSEFFLLKFDEEQKQWTMISESNPYVTISQSGLSAGSTLSIKYRDRPVTTDPLPNYPT